MTSQMRSTFDSHNNFNNHFNNHQDDDHNCSCVLNVNKAIMDTEHNDTFKLPKELLNALTSKWRMLFNNLLKNNKHAKVLVASIDTENFVNCRGVKFGDTRFTYDRIKKIFELFVSPINKQDNLCFEEWKQKKMIIKVKNTSLRSLFLDFFNQINKIYFCKDCGNFAYGIAFYETIDKCESCLFEEIAASQSSKEEICAICQETTKKWYTTKCGHKFHRKCLSQVVPNPILKCPICRRCLDTRDEVIEEYIQQQIRQDELSYNGESDEDVDEFNTGDIIEDSSGNVSL